MTERKQYETASLLVKTGNAVTYFRNRKTENIDLTSVQSDLLVDILQNPGITASEIKEHMQLSQSTVAGIIARLESKRLIDKVTDADDARKVFLYPAEQGRILEKKLQEIAAETQRNLVQGLNETEQAEFARFLKVALNNLNRLRQD